MTWETFYLICFVAGLMLSVVSLVGWDASAATFTCLISGTQSTFRMHPRQATCRRAEAGCTRPPARRQAWPTIPWWNGFSIMIFLCWFGAAGYLLMRYGSFAAGVVVVLALSLRPRWRSNHLFLPCQSTVAARARTHCGRDRGRGCGGTNFRPNSPRRNWGNGLRATGRAAFGCGAV